MAGKLSRNLIWGAHDVFCYYACTDETCFERWWGFTFPLASLTLCVLALGTELHLMFLKVLGTIMVGIVIALWVRFSAHSIFNQFGFYAKG